MHEVYLYIFIDTSLSISSLQPFNLLYRAYFLSSLFSTAPHPSIITSFHVIFSLAAFQSFPHFRQKTENLETVKDDPAIRIDARREKRFNKMKWSITIDKWNGRDGQKQTPASEAIGERGKLGSCCLCIVLVRTLIRPFATSKMCLYLLFVSSS